MTKISIYILSQPKKDLIDKLNNSTQIKDGHYFWTKNKNEKGYGIVTLKRGKQIFAHTLSAFLYLGLDLNDKSKLSLHKRECNIKHCWNPNHLYIGTAQDNTNDAKAMGHKPWSHAREAKRNKNNGQTHSQI